MIHATESNEERGRENFGDPRDPASSSTAALRDVQISARDKQTSTQEKKKKKKEGANPAASRASRKNVGPCPFSFPFAFLFHPRFFFFFLISSYPQLCLRSSVIKTGLSVRSAVATVALRFFFLFSRVLLFETEKRFATTLKKTEKKRKKPPRTFLLFFSRVYL